MTPARPTGGAPDPETLALKLCALPTPEKFLAAAPLYEKGSKAIAYRVAEMAMADMDLERLREASR